MNVRKTAAVLIAGILFACLIVPMLAGQGALAAPVVDYPIATGGSEPEGICVGIDGNIWFAEWTGNRIGRMTPAGAITEYIVPTAASNPGQIVAGPDGALWFAEKAGNKIGRITVTGAFTEYPIPTAASGSEYITAGPDGALWFTESTANKVGRITVTGALTEYPVPTAGSAPNGICAGPDGALWFTEWTGDRIGRINTTGAVTEYQVPTAGASPLSITAGPDGNLWFTELASDRIGSITPAGAIKEYPLAAGSTPNTIVTGPDGALWFTQAGDHKLGRMTTWGAASTQNIPTAGCNPYGITVGPGGDHLYFTERAANRIGRNTLYPGTVWYLAEGSTAWGFSEYVTIENPNTVAVNANVTYMTDTGPVPGGQVALPPTSQATIDPSTLLGARDFSTRVECVEGRTIAVDRTMTWTGTGAPSPEAHNSVGVTSPATTWYLPEGSSEWGFECWLLIQNPNGAAANCQITYMIEGAPPVTLNKTVAANSRATYNMETDIGRHDASIRVVSNLPVIPERAMYRNDRREGHDSIGTIAPASDYFLAEGASAWGFTTYVLVQNPNSSPVDVTLTYMTPTGHVPQAPFSMPANSRKTIRVNDHLPNQDVSTSVHGSRPIIAERAMYWDNGTGEACHDSIGMNAPHSAFYLPDGQTTDGRETWTLIQNPYLVGVNVQVSYLPDGGGAPVVINDTVPAYSRKTYNMADSGIAGRAAVMVTSRSPGLKLMVERAMYWNGRGAGTDTIGGYSN